MSLLKPTSIAVVGASHEPKKVGHEIFKNLVTQGFQGKVFPVNPKGGSILDRPVFASVASIPDTIDLAVIVTPAKTVPGILEECAAKAIKNAIVISVGFSEVHTDEGIALEQDVKRIAKKNGMRLIGPNCLGILRPSTGLNASFAAALPPKGGIALISQSGAAAVGLMDEATEIGLGFSLVLSIGNKTILDESDLLTMCADDPETKVVGLYLESIKDGRKFLSEAAGIVPKKPIVLLKSGITDAGGKAAASHTGALAGSDAGIQALCIQAGIHRAKTLDEFVDLLLTLGQEPPLLSPQIAIITNAGGPGILASDAAAGTGLELPPLESAQQTFLKERLPAAASIGNPIDIIGDSDAGRFAAALEACASDKNIDGVCVLLTPQIMTPCEEIAKTIVDRMKRSPLMPVVTSFIGSESVTEARKILKAGGIPTFPTPERAIAALASLLDRSAGRTRATVRTKNLRSRGSLPSGRQAAAPAKGKTRILSESEIQTLFSSYDLPLPRQAIAKTAEEAVSIADRIGYPVIAKISSQDILHKTDIGGVIGNLKAGKDVQDAFFRIQKLAPKTQQTSKPANQQTSKPFLSSSSNSFRRSTNS
ncbi:MAG: CoA-binding protein [Patescibacteria group bacterium]